MSNNIWKRVSKNGDEYLSQLKEAMRVASSSNVADVFLSNGQSASKFMEENNQPWNIEKIKDRDFIKLIEYSSRIGRLDYASSLIRNKKFRYMIGHELALSRETILNLMDRYPQSAITGVLLSKDISTETKNKLVDLSFSEEFIERKQFFNDIVRKVFINSYYEDGDDFDTVVDSMFDLFMYSDVPDFLKRFKLYQYAKNSTKDVNPLNIDNEDKNILGRLFKVSIESGEKSLSDMAKLLIDGRRILNDNEYYINGKFDITLLSEEEIATVLQYSDTMIGLHNFSCSINKEKSKIIKRGEDRIRNLMELSEYYDLTEKFIAPNEILTNLFSCITEEEVTPEKILEKINELKMKQEDHKESEDFVYKFIYLGDRKSMIDFRKTLQKGILPKTLDILQSNSEIPEEYKDLDDSDFEVSLNYNINPKKNGLYIAFSKELAEESKKGIGSLKFDHIVAKRETWNSEFEHEIAMAGIYVSVMVFDGNILFKSDKYDKIRNQEMQGLSYYGTGKYNLDPKCRDIELLFDIYKKLGGTEDVINGIRAITQGKKDEIVLARRNEVTDSIKEICQGMRIDVVDGIAKNLLPNQIELIETGSTKRGTNMPGDGDFDFAIKTSSYWFRDLLNNELMRRVPLGVKKPEVYNGDLRGASVRLLKTQETVDLDVSYSPKSLAFEYSPDECIEDRLHSIETQYPDDINYVTANIVIAKAILKKLGIYKKSVSNGGTPYGGMGGIGVENWILQNGGSFEQAMRSFVESSSAPSGRVVNYEEFVEKYPIYEYGNNHMTDFRKPIDKFGRPLYSPQRHRNYTCFFAESGVPACNEAFNEILREIDTSRSTRTFKVVSAADRVKCALIQSIFRPKEVIASRPQIQTCYSDMRNKINKYSNVMKKILAERRKMEAKNNIDFE